MVSMQFVETFTPQTEGNRVHGEECYRRHKKRKTVSKNYYFLYCNLLAASFYSSCAAAQVNSFPEDLRGEPLSLAQFMTLDECPAIFLACPGVTY